MNPNDDPWDDYRKRKRWFVWTLATIVPGLLIIGNALAWLFNTKAAVDVVGSAWMLAYAITGWRFVMVRCPRCKREFYGSFLVNFKLSDVFPFAKRCSRCGLEKWKDPKAADGAETR